MRVDRRIDQLVAVALERGERTLLVDAHEPGVSDHVGRENGRKPALDTWTRHECLAGESNLRGKA